MAIGRISGPLLKANLVRNGIDLAFETDLLYLDVNNNRIGIKTSAPQYELDVNGTTRTTNLIVTNRADIGSVNIVGNTISSDQQYLNLGTFDNVVYQNKLRIDSIDLEGNVISTNDSNANLELRPNGAGTVEVYADMNVTGDIHATGNISADGSITLGNEDTDDVIFNAKVASDIIPNADITYDLGSVTNRWNDIYVRNIVTDGVNANDLEVDGIDLVLRQGKIWFVATNGDDTKFGNHSQDPFATIKKALSVAQPGDTVYVYPGTYTEIFPLTIPVGVAVKGQGIRSVKIVPTIATQNNDAILLNGESTIEDLTIADFYSPGYAFKFAPGFTVTSRSPYIRNVTVLTKGTVTSPSDPRGYDAGDAGRGGFFDGAVATLNSNEAAALFHSVTFITPGVDAIVLTNGVRVEWLNSFTYFANRSIYAVDGATGLKGAGQTALRVGGTVGTISAGQTISYYDTDGTTLLESATIVSVDATGKIFVAGKQTGFETAEQRGGKTIQAFGDAKLSTAVKKFGTASLALDGTGDYAFIQSSNDFAYGTDDFTIEMWIYRTVSGLVQILHDQRTSSATTYAPVVFLNATNQIAYTDGEGATKITGSTTVPLNAWSHVALSRSGTSTRLFLNGVQEGSTYSDNRNYIATPVRIGSRWNDTGYFNGFIDDLRIVKGTAVYTANFTPPLTSGSVTPDTVLMARFDGENNSTTFEDDVVYAQDIRFSGGATANQITLADFTDFGAEVRLIGSASVYGNFGLVGDGPGVIMYAIGHNLAYIGNGKEVTNDPETVIQGNEVVETNNAKIRYSSVDHKGDFRVGDLFYVNQEDGSVNFSVSNFTVETTDGVTFVTDGNTTFVDGTKIETGNWRISGNTVETLTGDANIAAASGEINIESNVNINGSLDVTGNVTIGGNITIGDEETDTIQILAGIDSDIVPRVSSTYSLGTASKIWSTLYANEVTLDAISIRDNYIQTTTSNANLELRANGTGIILVPTNDVVIENDLTVNGTTTFNDNVTVTGNITHVGNTTQVGNYSIAGEFTNGNILIEDNYIATTATNSDLELRANGTGIILVPTNDVVIENNLTVNRTITLNDDVTVTGNITHIGDVVQTGNYSIAGEFTNGNILIEDNYIATTNTNSDLELRANGTGIILVPNNNVVIENDLTVTGTTTLNDNVTVTGNVTHIGDVVQTGNYSIAGEFTNGNILIEDNFITTTNTNSDLELRANGAGTILVPTNNVVVENDLTVNGLTTFNGLVNITGNITLEGTLTQIGNYSITNNVVIGQNLTVGAAAQFEEILVDDNFITTTSSNTNLELRANGTGKILIPNNDVEIINDVIVQGDVEVRNLTVSDTITSDKFSTGDILINDNFITTTLSNSNLELRATGTGNVLIPNNDVIIENELLIKGNTSLQDTVLTGTFTQVGNTTQTGNIDLTGNLNIDGTITVSSAAQFENILIDDNVITTTLSNSNLELRATQFGKVLIPDNSVEIAQDLLVGGNITVTNVTASNRVTADSFKVSDILIDDNVITTTIANSDLELRANGTGSVVFPTNDVIIDQDLTVVGTTSLTDLNLVGTISHTGNTTQTGNYTLNGNLSVSGNIDISSSLVQFEDIQISGNRIGTTLSNSTLELRANGTGIVLIPNNDVEISNNLTVAESITTDVLTVTSTVTSDRFTTGNILIEDNTISTTNSNSDLELRANGTGSIVIDDFEISEASITSVSDITLIPSAGSVNVIGSGSLTIPAGSTAERPSGIAGQIIFNTQLARFEGFNGTNFINLKGVEDLDGDTRVTAELTEGSNDNVVRVFVQDAEVVNINNERLLTQQVDAGNVRISNNTISTISNNTNLVLQAQGTGSVRFDNLSIKGNAIRNTQTDAILEFQNTNNGYVKFGGTYGIVFPAGSGGTRPPIEFSETGSARYNTDDKRIEVWDGRNWVSVAGSDAGITRIDAESIAFDIVLTLG